MGNCKHKNLQLEVLNCKNGKLVIQASLGALL